MGMTGKLAPEERERMVWGFMEDGHVDVVAKRRSFTKKTFDVDEAALVAFNQARHALGLSMREAFNEAINLWVKSKTG